MFLLNNGADVLQELVDYDGEKTTVSKLSLHYPDLAKMLAQAECEERVKRGTTHGLSLLNFFPLRLVGDKLCVNWMSNL